MRRRFSPALVCGLLAGTVVFALRSGVDIIWDDTPHLSAVAHDPELTDGFAETSIWSPGFLALTIEHSFGEPSLSGYRPASDVLRHVGLEFFREGGPPRVIWIAFVGMLVAALGAVTFLVARRFTRTDAGASLAVVLFLCSPPYLCSIWVVYAGIQTIVPLAICSVLLLYWRLVDGWEAGQRRPWALVGLGTLMLFGPWFREFIGLGAALVIGLEVLRRGRPTWLAGFAALSLLHAVYPTSIVRLLAYPELPFVPIHRMGHLGTQVGLEKGSTLRWEAVPVLLLLLPSPILLIALAGSVHRSRSGTCAPGGSPDRRWPSAFLWTWFALSFVPFLKLFVEHVHLLYALLPMSVLLARGVESCSELVADRGRVLRVGFAALLVLGVSDRLLQLNASWRTTLAIVDGYTRVAEALEPHLGPDDCVVTNVLSGEEIRHHTGGVCRFEYCVLDGVAHPDRVVDEPHEFEALVRRTRPRGDVFLLAVEFDYLPGKAFYHRHRYASYDNVAVERLGTMHETRAAYAYLDPLKAIVPRDWMAFPSSPDLMNDFYLGPARSGHPFTREVHAEYRLFRVVGDEVDPYLPRGGVRLVESRDEWNVLECNGRFFALHHLEGEFDIARALRGELVTCKFADTHADIDAWIDDHGDDFGSTEEILNRIELARGPSAGRQ